MTNSTIKTKIGQCLDCPTGTKDQPIIAKRCQKHYKIHRANICKEKNKGNDIKPIKPIPRVSERRKKENREYTIKRLQFLAQPGNQRCPITGQMTTDIHHMKGRVGSLFLDTKFWLAVSREGHRKIEENPEWAKENGYSINRISV